jgi:V8-like Glu-specific endopeptidase
MLLLRAFLLSLLGFSLNLYSYFSPSERIIGTNDLTPLKISKQSHSYLKAIGMMSLGCTVTHLGEGYAITAGHCLTKNKSKKVTNKPCDKSKYDISWGRTQDTTSPLTSRCLRVLLLEFTSKNDYAIIKVSPYPLEKIEVATPDEIKNQETIKIISYPRRRPLESSKTCIANYSNKHPIKKRWFYECDTEPGSSGASLLNKDNKIIGIHNSYARSLNKNNGTNIINTLVYDFLDLIYN